MPIIVEHRADQLLQNSVARGVEPRFVGTYIEEVTVPAHKLLLAFLDQNVVGRTFEDENALNKTLNTWPDFAIAGGFDIERYAKDWKEMGIQDGDVTVDSSSPGGPLHIGRIVRD